VGGDDPNNETFRIRISQDHLSAHLVIEPGVDAGQLSADRIDASCADRNLVSSKERMGLIREAIERYVEESPKTTFEVEIARGRPPQHGTDGHVAFEQGLDPREEPERPEPDEAIEGSVDFYSQSAFTIVAQGQRIGRLVDPTEGVDGYDVTGKPLGAKDGRPLELKTDTSVTLDRDQRIIAQTSGIIEFAGGRLRVLDTLHIGENVDFSTGNLDFPGDVVIGGGVKDCFRVRVGGSLTVRELVEAATLTVATDCTLHRGMASRSKGSLTTGRDLCATYVDNATILVGRDLIVAREITGCTAQVSRKVASPSAVMVGGTLTAGDRCELGQVGTESGSKTTLVLGRLPEVDDLATRLSEMLPEADKRFKRLMKQRETLLALGPNLSAEQAEELATLHRTVPEAEDRIARIRSGLERLWSTHQANTRAELVVEKVLHAGVRICLGGFEATMKQDVRGPVTIRLVDDMPSIQRGEGSGEALSTVATVVSSDSFPDLKRLAEPPAPAKAA